VLGGSAVVGGDVEGGAVVGAPVVGVVVLDGPVVVVESVVVESVVVVVVESDGAPGSSVDASAGAVSNGFGGLPGFVPPNPMMSATTPATAAPPSAPTDIAVIVERSRSHSVARRRSSCSDSTVCWFSHAMNGALA
jgi:hypothetical protein